MSQANDAALRSDLFKMVKGKVPEQDAEDIVQTTLMEALSSPTAPKDGEARRKWAFGVARNKIADYYRRSRRETFEVPDVAAPPASHEERDMLRWAEEALPDGAEAPKTLEWMLREGEGEKLEAIAASEKLPAPRVRQRVSRLRRHLKQHWAKEVAVLAALGVIAVVAFLLLRQKKDDIAKPQPDPSAHAPTPMELAKKTRKDALEKCRQAAWDACERGLDEAKAVDPAGEDDPDVKAARAAASAAKQPAPTPSASPSATLPPIPTATTPPTTTTTPAPPSSGFFNMNPKGWPKSDLSATPKPDSTTPSFAPSAFPANELKVRPQAKPQSQINATPTTDVLGTTDTPTKDVAPVTKGGSKAGPTK
jgi:RNA polymerase sigma factor (sigma-70 family)